MGRDHPTAFSAESSREPPAGAKESRSSRVSPVEPSAVRHGNRQEGCHVRNGKAAEAHAPWVYADLRPANDESGTMFRRILDFDPISAS